MAAISTQPKTALKGTITFSDGTGTPVTLAILFSQGDSNIPQIGEYLNEPVIMTARSEFAGLSSGAPRFPQYSFTALCSNLVGSSSTAPGSPMEFAHRKGAYSANVSTLGANRRSTIDIILNVEGTDWGDSDDETITLEDCMVEISWQESLEGNVISFACTVLGDVIFSNSTNTITYAQAA